MDSGLEEGIYIQTYPEYTSEYLFIISHELTNFPLFLMLYFSHRKLKSKHFFAGKWTFNSIIQLEEIAHLYFRHLDTVASIERNFKI